MANSTAIELDGIGYATMAEQFVRGLFSQALGSVFPPVYPLIVASFHLFIPDVELAGRLVSLVFGMATIYVSFLFARRLLHDETKAVWVVFLLALQPYLVRYSGAVLSESLAVFLFSVTVFAFYVGWQEGRSWYIAVAGFCLTLTYLTRPEYLIFYVPFVAFLAKGRRIKDLFLLLLPFFVLGLLYICYLRIETGLWMVSKKAVPSPFAMLHAFAGNVSLVSYEFIIALYPLFVFLATLGLNKVERPYRNLVLGLIIFHVLSLCFVGHSTKRYSVEFIPICMVFVVEGIYASRGYSKGIFFQRSFIYIVVLVIMCLTAFQTFTPIRNDRALHKQAGVFLLRYGPGSLIAARLPIVAFYARGKPIDLAHEIGGKKDLAHFLEIVSEKKVAYLVVDEETEEEFPFLRNYPTSAPLREFRNKQSFVRLYRLPYG